MIYVLVNVCKPDVIILLKGRNGIDIEKKVDLWIESQIGPKPESHRKLHRWQQKARKLNINLFLDMLGMKSVAYQYVYVDPLTARNLNEY